MQYGNVGWVKEQLKNTQRAINEIEAERIVNIDNGLSVLTN